VEEPIDRTLFRVQKGKVESKFIRESHGSTPTSVFDSLDQGLQHLGWAEVPGSGKILGEGKFGVLKLVYRTEHSRTRPEEMIRLDSSQFAAVKQQPPPPRQGRPAVWLEEMGILMIWQEIRIMRGLVHENVIDYIDHFVFYPRQKEVHIAMMLEFASAGDLETEVKRYPVHPESKSVPQEHEIPEKGARYYTHQIANGLKYIHSKFIIHNDLHEGNILLKYNSDGSKTCMLADFGQSIVLDPDNYKADAFRADVQSLAYFVAIMTGYMDPLTHAHMNKDLVNLCQQACLDLKCIPDSVDEFVNTHNWFKGKMRAPFPKPPTPVLKPEQVAEMGFKQPKEPPPGWSRYQVTRRRMGSRFKSLETVPQQVRQSFDYLRGRTRADSGWSMDSDSPHKAGKSRAPSSSVAQQQPKTGPSLRQRMGSLTRAVGGLFTRRRGGREEETTVVSRNSEPSGDTDFWFTIARGSL
jgi:serine/threonine protein kinase